MKFKVFRILAVLLTVVFFANFFSNIARADADVGLVAVEDNTGSYADFQTVLTDYAKKYNGKTHEQVFGKGYANQWCAEYVNKMLTDAYTDCCWKTDNAWGALDGNIPLAAAWAAEFESQTYGGYYCWKSWQSNTIGYIGTTTTNTDCYVPRVGDIICINWKPDPNATEPSPNAKDINHVGIIYQVDSIYKIQVSEGNIGGEDDPRYNKVINREWSRTTLDGKFEIPSGTVVAICRPQFPKQVRNVDCFEMDITILVDTSDLFRNNYSSDSLSKYPQTTY